MLILIGSEDPFLPVCRKFLEMAKEHGGTAEIEVYEGQPHAFFNRPQWRTRTVLRADRFLRKIGVLKETPRVSLTAEENAGGLQSKSFKALACVGDGNPRHRPDLYLPGRGSEPAARCLDSRGRMAEGTEGPVMNLIWIELFDPHEPWDPPPKYYAMYANPEYDGPHIIGPQYHSVPAEDFTPEELEELRALYDRESDPYELHDVAGEHPDVCALMRGRLRRFWEDARLLNP